MIYKKLEGTTSRSFQIAKNGIEFSLLNEGLHIYTPKTNAVFELGVDDLKLAGNNDIPNSKAIVDYINNEVLDFGDSINDALNSLGEVIDAIGNDPDFFTNLVEILGTDYVDNGVLAVPIDIPDLENDGSGDIGKDGLLDASTLEKTASVSKRLSILEKQKSGERLSLLRSFSQTSDDNANITNKNLRDNHYLYLYEDKTGQVIQKKISIQEIRKLRPGIYTGAQDKDLESKDYIFTEITGGN
jgi:hypothetical protein